jgi:hypothetical protein
MQEDSGSVVPAKVEELPTEAAELRIFLIPASRKGRRGRIAALITHLRRGTYRARAERDHR